MVPRTKAPPTRAARTKLQRGRQLNRRIGPIERRRERRTRTPAGKKHGRQRLLHLLLEVAGSDGRLLAGPDFGGQGSKGRSHQPTVPEEVASDTPEGKQNNDTDRPYFETRQNKRRVQVPVYVGMYAKRKIDDVQAREACVCAYTKEECGRAKKTPTACVERSSSRSPQAQSTSRTSTRSARTQLR